MDDPPGTATDEHIAFGVRLRHARGAAGLTQEELAARAGLTPNAVGSLERGEHRHPYPATVRALATALGLSGAERAALAASVPKRCGGALVADRLAGLTMPRTRLVGREREVAAVGALLRDPAVALLTLSGPGGVGKTRLALAVAAAVADAFADGVRFVPLAPIRDPNLVLPAIARSLGTGEVHERPLVEHVAVLLRSRRMLLVLDNFEQVTDAGPLVGDLLSGCPWLKLLVTSRALLRVSGEYDFPVPPLTLPDAAAPFDLGTVEGCDAVRLYVERARAVDPGFALSTENAAAVAAICRRLDGLPLAIELAAARSNLLAPTALLPRLARRLPLLTGGPRDLPARLRTMRDAIDWSYDLLDPLERALFRRLSVFVGGFGIEGAEAVAATCPAIDALQGLASLVDKSLIQRSPQPGGGLRLRMLETVREYGLERLAEAGEEATANDAHAAYYAGLGEWLDPNRFGPGERFDDRLFRIEAELPNLRAALCWLRDSGQGVAVLRIAGALAVFWHHRGLLREGRRWLEWGLANAGECPATVRGRSLAGLSLILWTQNQPDQAEPLARDGLAIAEEVGDEELVALSIHVLGIADVVRLRWATAGALMEDALGRWRRLGLPSDAAMALIALSAVADGLGDADASRRYAQDAQSLFREVGHDSGAAFAFVRLARLAAFRGDDRNAAMAYRQALGLWSGIGERWAIVQALSALAALAAAHGQPATAAVLSGAIDALQEGGDLDIFPSDRGNYDAAVGVRGSLGEARFTELFETGRTMRLEEAVAAALAVAVPDATTGAAQLAPGAGALTPREHEVLRHLAAGRTDQEIADALFVSRRTVNAHVSHILAKLGVGNRRGAATVADRDRLV